jgi:hypothetical protein
MKTLSGFLRRAEKDHRIGPLHVSLYVVLWDICNAKTTQQVIAISRNDIMSKAKIKSPGTYYKVIKDLSDWGYVTYISQRYGGKVSKAGVVS